MDYDAAKVDDVILALLYLNVVEAGTLKRRSCPRWRHGGERMR